MDKPDFTNVQGGSSSTASSGDMREQSSPRTYTVVAGDSLSKIAKHVYGDAQEWRKIYDANRDTVQNPDLIHPGQTLRLP